ncbi:MAG: helix-turn-helix transcriptional regulator [Clostridia bacterium]|nr:helix-turn-helix transcriptional regulator [Clostridia bacterium]
MDCIKLLVCVKVFRENFQMESFCGSDDIFVLVQDGSFSFESSSGKQIVQKNEGALFRRNVLYQRKVLTPVTMYLFRYHSDMLCFNDEKVVFHNTERILSTLDLLDKIENIPFTDLHMYRKMLFCDIVMQHHIENGITHFDVKPQDKAVNKAIAIINQNYNKKINVDELADVCELSHAQFYRRFYCAMNCSPYNYVLKLRLQKAEDLLVNSNLPIHRVGMLCGFDDEFYFSNFFKKHMGISPTAFRKAAF